MKGSSIKKCFTLGSMYDNNSVVVWTRSCSYRINADELLKLVKKADFKVIKRRIHKYLEVI